MSYHSGKDGGLFKRLESVILLNILFYLIMSKRNRILYTLIGFVISIISSYVTVMIFGLLPDPINENTIMHLTTFGISYLSFFGIEKLFENKKAIANNG